MVPGTGQCQSWAWAGGLWAKTPIVKLASVLGKQSSLDPPLHAREAAAPESQVGQGLDFIRTQEQRDFSSQSPIP